MTSRVFIDTNIIIYAHIKNEIDKHSIALTLLKDTLKGTRIWISTQILSEFYSALNKNKIGHDKIVGFINTMTQQMNVCPVTLDIVEKALSIKDKYQLSYWDSLMLSAALECECDEVFTEDLQHKQVINNKLTIINPFKIKRM